MLAVKLMRQHPWMDSADAFSRAEVIQPTNPAAALASHDPNANEDYDAPSNHNGG